jgi:DNA-directed RNA polymerase subunit M/transcription elongation factor TFIIS
MGRRFARNVEDFVCEKCGNKVRGNGYTNHCPRCLHSKHVDINPGDRQSNCGGMMEPIAVESNSKGYIVTFRCTKCGATKRNKSAEGDDFEKILEIARESARR